MDRDSVSRGPVKKKENVFVATEIVVFRHSPGACRHCGHVYEQAICCQPDAPKNCPACGCPMLKPEERTKCH